MAYSFGYSSEDAVDIPLLDAFIAELNALCEKYGVSFEHESYGDDYGQSAVLLKPYDGSPGDLFDSLENAVEGIPWLDAARRAYNDRINARYAAQRETKERQAAAQRAAQEAYAVENGVVLNGTLYKLVKE